MSDLRAALDARLHALTRNARMWGSPEELEAVALHFTHARRLVDDPAWTFEQTFEQWKARGGPFAQDAEAHAAMRARMWGEAIEQARRQVVEGYLVVWTSLAREPSREALLSKHLEGLLDFPERISTPDRLNMVLFALMGFVAVDPQRYVHALNLERHRIGGHELRPFPVVAPRGPSDAASPWGRHFSSWDRVLGALRP